MKYESLVSGKEYVINIKASNSHAYDIGTVVRYKGAREVPPGFTQFEYVKGPYTSKVPQISQTLEIASLVPIETLHPILVGMDAARELFKSTTDERVKELLKRGFKLSDLEKNEYPESWSELGDVEGWYIASRSFIQPLDPEEANGSNTNTFTTLELAEASSAMSQLHQYHKAWRQIEGGEIPSSYAPSFGVTIENGALVITNRSFYSNDLNQFNFRTAEVRDHFLTSFKSLLENAMPFLR